MRHVYKLLIVKLQELRILREFSLQQNVSFNRKKVSFVNLYKELELLINAFSAIDFFLSANKLISGVLPLYNQYLSEELDNRYCFL